MRVWLRWASFTTCGAAVAIGCGSSGSGGSFDLGDSGSKGDSASSGSGGSSGGGSGSTSGSSSGGSFGDGGGDDATTGSSTSSGGGVGDATLDIAFPDSFYGPEASPPDGSGGADSTAGEGGTACSPQGVTCQGSVAEICSSGVLTTTDCSTLSPAQTCASGFGCVVCQPGTGSCSGSTGTACNAAGTGTTTSVCDPLLGEACVAATGQCSGDCANLGASYIGCEYYAVTMSNSTLNQGVFYFSVSLSNTSVNPATVTITGPAAYTTTATIPAGTLMEFHLPWEKALSCSGTCNGTTSGLPATTALVAGGAYHIKTTEPVSAYEFNARDYQIGTNYSYTNDASLLIPVNAMTGNYRVMAGATWFFTSGSIQYPGDVAIIGTVAGTKVTYAAPSGNTPSRRRRGSRPRAGR